MQTDNQGLISVTEAANLMGRTPQGVTKAIREGRLKAIRVGSQWVISITEFRGFYKKYKKGELKNEN